MNRRRSRPLISGNAATLLGMAGLAALIIYVMRNPPEVRVRTSLDTDALTQDLMRLGQSSRQIIDSFRKRA